MQEFSIQASNYSAAQGHNPGVMVNVVTKSGTHELHGDAFEFVRNRVFNARHFFASQHDPQKTGNCNATVNLRKFIPQVGGDERLVFGRNIAQEWDQCVAKIDHKLSAQDQLSGRYFIAHFRNAASYNDDNLLTYRGGRNQSRVRTQNVALSWIRVFSPTLLNDFNFGSNRVHSRRAAAA